MSVQDSQTSTNQKPQIIQIPYTPQTSSQIQTSPQIQTLQITQINKTPNKPMQLTGEELRKKLEGYFPIADIEQIPINTHMRYFLKNTQGKWVFKIGGFLKKNEPTFIYLSRSPAFSGGGIWKVIKENAKFYYKPKAPRLPGNSGNSGNSGALKSKTAYTSTEFKVNQLSKSSLLVSEDGRNDQTNQTNQITNQAMQAHQANKVNEIIQELNALKEVNRQYRFALEQQQNQIQQLRRQLAQQQ